MARHTPTLAENLERWRVAKRLTLSLIVMMGALTATISIGHSLAMKHHESMVRCQRGGLESFGGIGVLLSGRHGSAHIEHVYSNMPAEGKLRAGGYIVAVDGETAHSLVGWTRLIRGEPGESVSLRVRYGDGATETVVIDRTLIQARR